MRKKAQGLSVTTIIVAAIALIVLVVLIAIFTGRIGLFSSTVGKLTGDSTKTCAELSQEHGIEYSLTTPKTCDDEKGGTILSSDSINKPDQVCCTI